MAETRCQSCCGAEGRNWNKEWEIPCLLLRGRGRKKENKRAEEKLEEKMTNIKVTLCRVKDLEASLTLCLVGRLTFR